MKKKRLKRISIYIGVVFLIIVAVLTYFSSTIDRMLLPKVKTTTVCSGTLSDNVGLSVETLLIPISAVSGFEDNIIVYVVDCNDKDYIVCEVEVELLANNEVYYEVSSSNLYIGDRIVYSTSKSISDGDRVCVEE